jgi:hypothetical protein
MLGAVRHLGTRTLKRKLGIVALAGLTAGVVQAQGPITLYISAVDASGAAVDDLKPEEISYKEAGNAGKIVSVEKFSLPVKLTIAVDNGPDSPSAFSHYRTGLTDLVNQLPPEMEVTLITMAPQPRMVVKPTTNREEILRGVTRFGPDDQPARFTDTIVEYSQRLEKEVKDSKGKRLPYSPALIIVSTTAAESTSYPNVADVSKAISNIANLGGRVHIAMTVTKVGSTEAVADLNSGRQALIGIPLTKETRGRYEGLAQSSRLATLLPEYGKNVVDSHKRQVKQVKVTIERPAGATGGLQDLDVRLLRPGLNGGVSGNGVFYP